MSIKAAVTGSSGFVGQHLIKSLRSKDFEFVKLDLQDGVDITDWKQIRSTEKFDVLFHLAAKTFVPDSFKNPRSFYYTNISGTLNALELCRLNNAKMIFASSYIYGQPQYLPIDETHPIVAFNPYAQTKVIGEQLCESYHRNFGVPIVILRPFNIYGYGQNENFLIPTMLKQMKEGVISLKDPEPKRDMVFIDDVIEAYINAAEYDQNGFDIFNIGSGISYSIQEIVDQITASSDQEIKVEFSGEKRKNEVLNTIADISKAKKLLNWNPKITFNEGLNILSMKWG